MLLVPNTAVHDFRPSGLHRDARSAHPSMPWKTRHGCGEALLAEIVHQPQQADQWAVRVMACSIVGLPQDVPIHKPLQTSKYLLEPAQTASITHAPCSFNDRVSEAACTNVERAGC